MGEKIFYNKNRKLSLLFPFNPDPPLAPMKDEVKPMTTIMIVDDETRSQEAIRKYILTRLPAYEIAGVYNNGLEALEAFRRKPADILLVDIRMPVMDGLTLIGELNKLSQDYVPVIISSYGEFEYAKTAMGLGVVHYLLKPLDYDELSRCLAAAAQTLDFRRISHNSLSLREDDQELYLFDVITGKYSDQSAAFRRFRELDFPFSYDRTGGICIQVRFLAAKGWAYGKDALFTAAGNLFRLLYHPDYLLPIFQKSNSCDYLTFFAHETSPQEDFGLFIQQAGELLQAEITVKPLFSFESTEQLRARSIAYRSSQENFTAPAEAPATPEEDALSEEEQSEINDAVRESIDKAVSYIRNHFQEDLTREDVAAKVFMSGAYFSRCFKLVTQTTYKDYLTELRMRRAIELLKTNLRVQDIARAVGYPNINRFNINFRQYTSYTPSEYRLRVLKLF